MNFIDKMIAIKKEEITEIDAKDIFQRLENMSVVELSKKSFCLINLILLLKSSVAHLLKVI
ncbi:hypothetical protein [Piscirickettsia salmonis]|uniref:hypothetical protein n=1 Tax=Piscirickettsia salmonis TaxID=1238 RepID=UPI000AF79DF0|nr:hypothetical protein [Piscirickettsia salmonis]